MIKFAVKSLVVLVLVGHVIKLTDPVEPVEAEARFMPASYSEGEDLAQRDVSRDLSTFTNAQIVVSSTARDASGFCDREPMACQSGRELVVRLASGVRDVAGNLVNWAEEDGTAKVEEVEEEYRPLKDYQGSYPLLPAEPPARSNSF